MAAANQSSGNIKANKVVVRRELRVLKNDGTDLLSCVNDEIKLDNLSIDALSADEATIDGVSVTNGLEAKDITVNQGLTLEDPDNTGFGNVHAGRYTPTYSNMVHCTVVEFDAYYQRIGNIVSVTGRATVLLESGGVSSSFDISLPIERKEVFGTNGEYGIGFGTLRNTTVPSGSIQNILDTQIMRVSFDKEFSYSSGSSTFNYCFTYQLN